MIVNINLKTTENEINLFGNLIECEDKKTKEKKFIKTLVKTFNGKILNFNERKLYGVDGVLNN